MIFHMNPGYLEVDPIYWFKPEFNVVFNEVFRRYAPVVVGIYSGHAHTDSFRLIYKNGMTLTASHYSCLNMTDIRLFYFLN